MTRWQVYKFGGSSLAAPGGLDRVLALIDAAHAPDPGPQVPPRLVVVVSALGDSTDELIAAAQAAADGRRERAEAALGEVERVARATAAAVLPAPAQAELVATLAPVLAELRQIIAGVGLVGELTARTLDHVMAFGERISAEVVAAAVRVRLGHAAWAADARAFVRTDDRAGEAVVDVATTSTLVRAALDRPGLPVVTGFIGQSGSGRTTTLGRNGSDYTASLLAAALAAGHVTVWTDVPGVFTADPGLVAEAYPVTRLTYREALELAHFGTRMFHARTMVPLRDAGIALTIRSTLDPAAPGTRIDADGHGADQQPTCVTSMEGLALVLVEATRSALPPALLAEAHAALDQRGVRVWMTNQTGLGVSASFVVGVAALPVATELLTTLAARSGADVVVTPAPHPVTLVTLVAERMGQHANVAGRFFAALGTIGVRVRAIAQGASERSISCVVDGADTAAAVRAVHAAFHFAEAELHVLLLGHGTVGGALLAQIDAQRELLRRDHGVRLRLVGVVDRERVVFDPTGLEPAAAVAALRVVPGGVAAAMPALLERLARLSVPVLVDCTAADGMEVVYAQAFARGVHVVAANKKPLVLPGPARAALLAGARAHSRAYLYETTCGASLPVIETLKNLVRTGDVVERIDGSLSGTLAYLTDALMHGTPLSRAVAEARARGLTEPNPRDDLSGLDVARKAVILARELGASVELADVAIEPLVDARWLGQDDPDRFVASLVELDAAFADRVERARAAGLTLRYLAQIERVGAGAGVRVKVGPVAVPAEHPATSLRGQEAMIAFTTRRYAAYPLIVRGAGAGGDVTAAGVLADVLRLATTVRGG